MIAALSDWITAAPLAFGLGTLFGMLLSSRYVMIRRRNGASGKPPP